MLLKSVPKPFCRLSTAPPTARPAASAALPAFSATVFEASAAA